MSVDASRELVSQEVRKLESSLDGNGYLMKIFNWKFSMTKEMVTSAFQKVHLNNIVQLYTWGIKFYCLCQVVTVAFKSPSIY